MSDLKNHRTLLKQGTTTILQNTFDGDGVRVIRAVNGTTTYYLGDWCELNPSTGTYTNYYPSSGQAFALKQGTSLYYLHRDQVGSTVSISDSSAGEVASLRYWPYGGLRLSTGSLPTDRLFTGQTRDLNNDAYYFVKSRHYDATIDRFHIPDSMVPGAGSPQALNRYAYALNNPLRFHDPSGHMVSVDPLGGGEYSPPPISLPPTPPTPTLPASLVGPSPSPLPTRTQTPAPYPSSSPAPTSTPMPAPTAAPGGTPYPASSGLGWNLPFGQAAHAAGVDQPNLYDLAGGMASWYGGLVAYQGQQLMQEEGARLAGQVLGAAAEAPARLGGPIIDFALGAIQESRNGGSLARSVLVGSGSAAGGVVAVGAVALVVVAPETLLRLAAYLVVMAGVDYVGSHIGAYGAGQFANWAGLS